MTKIFYRSKTHLVILLSPAVRTGREPATPCVTGRYSNQLNYRTRICMSLLDLFVVCECKVITDFLIMQVFSKFFLIFF